MRRFPRLSMLGALALLAMAAGVSSPAVADDSLYQQFGGKIGLEHVIDDFYDRMLEDPRTKSYFEGVSIPHLEKLLNQQLCELMGGPCHYTGRSMKRSHEGLGIDHAAFEAGVDALKQAMAKNHIPADAQQKLLEKIAPMARDIEEH